jgi:hypothetical protein
VNNAGTKKLALQNTQHFEEKEGDIAPCLKKLVFIFVE